MTVSRSRTVYPQLTPLTLDGTVLKESADLVILGVTFDAKMTFEKHLCSVSSAAAQRLGITRKSWRSGPELCMLFKTNSNPMHPLKLSGALPLPYVPAHVTRGALVAHRHSLAPLRCRTSQYRRTFMPLSVSLCNDLSYPVFDGVGLAGLMSRANAFLLA